MAPLETLDLGVGSSPDLSSLVPVPAAYDNITYFNDHEPERTEAAVFDPNTGVFTILGPTGSTYTVSSGFQKGDIPVPADYLGDGEAQAVVFRPSTGQFIEAGGTVIATFSQASTDVPLAAPLSYRTPSAQSRPQPPVRERVPGLVQVRAPGRVRQRPGRVRQRPGRVRQRQDRDRYGRHWFKSFFSGDGFVNDDDDNFDVVAHEFTTTCRIP